MKAFDDCCCINEISSTQHAHEMWIELSDLYSGRAMHFVGKVGRGRGGDLHGRKREGGVKRQKTTAPLAEDSCSFGFVEAPASLMLTQANKCDRFAASSDLEQPRITHQPTRSAAGTHVKPGFEKL